MRHNIRGVLNYVIFSFIFFGTALIIGKNVLFSDRSNDIATSQGITTDENREVWFVIDAGHGGEDGGAVSEDVVEKDLNLQIAQALKKLCDTCGVNAVMTREDDRLLYDYYGDLKDYKGKKKTYDLRNRLKLTESNNPKLFISIHMNKFSEAKYGGLQVYYSPNDKRSEEAAEIVQSYVKSYISPENDRKIKKADKSIYLLNQIKTPGILIECGFLSNQSDKEKLMTEEYREKMASVIFAACLKYAMNNE